jgi:hypothetical protein
MSVKDIMGQDNRICEHYIAPRVTKGQLVAGNKHSQKTAVPVGEDGSFLQADSTAETGLRWVKLGEGELVTGKGSGQWHVHCTSRAHKLRADCKFRAARGSPMERHSRHHCSKFSRKRIRPRCSHPQVQPSIFPSR